MLTSLRMQAPRAAKVLFAAVAGDSLIQPSDRCIEFSGRYDSGGIQLEYLPEIAAGVVRLILKSASTTALDMSSGTCRSAPMLHSGYSEVVVLNGNSDPTFFGSKTLSRPASISPLSSIVSQRSVRTMPMSAAPEITSRTIFFWLYANRTSLGSTCSSKTGDRYEGASYRGK